MTTFLNALENEFNQTTTANGAKAYKSTESKCLDLFGKIAACRDNISEATRLFNLAYAEDPETATRILFWARDIRGGQGERKIFREVFKELVRSDTAVGEKLVGAGTTLLHSKELPCGTLRSKCLKNSLTPI